MMLAANEAAKIMAELEDIETKGVGAFQRSCCDSCEQSGRAALENMTAKVRRLVRQNTEKTE